MANERFTDLPIAAPASMSDIICSVQGYVNPSTIGISTQATLAQIYTLFGTNTVLSFAGNPNGHVAGTTYQLCWDITNTLLYVCIETGDETSAVWLKSIRLTAGAGIGIVQSGNNITISSTVFTTAWNQVTTNITMISGNGYQVNTGSAVNLLLPTTSFFGDEINIMGFGGGFWTITQAAGQQVIIGAASTTIGAGGTATSTNRYDSIKLVCQVPNTVWAALGGPEGSITLV